MYPQFAQNWNRIGKLSVPSDFFSPLAGTI
jgi:hypothetical protein